MCKLHVHVCAAASFDTQTKQSFKVFLSIPVFLDTLKVRDFDICGGSSVQARFSHPSLSFESILGHCCPMSVCGFHNHAFK